MINLNDEGFDQKQTTFKPFNAGIAGLVENVTMSMSKKKKEEHEKAPDYKIVFTDEDGAICNTSLYYITEDTQYATKDQQVVKQGKILKHLLHAVISPTFKFPAFETEKAMLDGCMKALKDSATPGVKYRIFTNFGVKSSPKQFAQPRSWVPFIETMDVVESRLTLSDLDAMERLAPDNDGPKKTKGAASAEVADEDWD